MAGRPPLRIGQHGKVTRLDLGGGIWVARCRYRDIDGVVRIVERRGPADENDYYGKLAEDALIEALIGRRPPAAGPDEISLDSLVMGLVEQYLARLAEDGRAIRTMDTYSYDATKLARFLSGVRVGEATPGRLDAALRSMKNAHGPTMARRAKGLLKGGLQLAVLHNILGTNPVRDVEKITSNRRPQGAPALTGEELHELFGKLRSSDQCRNADLLDPITVLIATGLRRSELLGLRWSDFDAKAALIVVRGKVVRHRGKGLVRVEETKTAAGFRTIPVPALGVEALNLRRKLPFLGQQTIIFPSTAGTLRDPDNFGKQWRRVRSELGAPDVTSHSFRKSVATIIDDAGLSARIGADHLGHANVSMTQDRYMARGRVHSEVANLIDRAVGKNDE
jgi:integrase